jgi:hypothetical protein
MKKILSLVLIITLAFSAIPTSFAASMGNLNANDGLSVRSFDPDDKFDGAEVVRGPEVLSLKKPNRVTRATINSALIGASTYLLQIPGFCLAVAAAAYDAHKDDPSIDGIYTKTYYCRKQVLPNDDHPYYRLYQYEYKTFIYRSSSMSDRNIVAVESVNDGQPRLARVN